LAGPEVGLAPLVTVERIEGFSNNSGIRGDYETSRALERLGADVGLSKRLPLSINRALVLEAIALIVLRVWLSLSSTASCPTWWISDRPSETDTRFIVKDGAGRWIGMSKPMVTPSD
jgi:hypothetical protein